MIIVKLDFLIISFHHLTVVHRSSRRLFFLRRSDQSAFVDARPASNLNVEPPALDPRTNRKHTSRDIALMILHEEKNSNYATHFWGFVGIQT